MKIKAVDGSYREVEETFSRCCRTNQQTVWVAWSDIKTIIAEYQDKVDTLQEALANASVALENTQVGCADYGLMGNAMLEDSE